MSTLRTRLTSILCAALCTLSIGTWAADSVSPRTFIDEASAKGIAAIETAKLAQDKATSADLKSYARQIIDDHTASNQALAKLASDHALPVADDAELVSKAKAMILQLRDGESFDRAYANNQVMAHEQMIALYRQAVNADDTPISAFARETLPQLEHHLQMAKDLVSVTHAH